MKGIVCKYEFDPDTVRELIQNIFNEGEIEVVVKPTTIDARLYNGNTFHISIWNHTGVIYANCRRKYTSLKPDWENDININIANLEGTLEAIKLKLTQFNEKVLRGR